MTKGGGPIALAAGGTGGHMFPAEALAQELKRRGHEILLITDARGARYTDNFPADQQIELSASSPSIGGVLAKIRAAFSITGGLIKALKVLRENNVSAAIGFGGYPSFAGMKAASLLKIPYGVHEQNGVLGRANRQLANGSVFTAHAFPVLDKVPDKARDLLREVGNPLRDSVSAYIDTPYPALENDGPIRVVIFGGSQGASLFSEVPPKVLASLPQELRQRLEIIHQAREKEVAEVEAIYNSADIKHTAAPFFHDLPEIIAKAHLIVSRAGASTVTEISAIGRPSILVPLGIAMDDHQTGNAKVLSEASGAVLLPESRFTKENLTEVMTSLLKDPATLSGMAIKARARVKEGAASTLADMVEAMMRDRTDQ